MTKEDIVRIAENKALIDEQEADIKVLKEALEADDLLYMVFRKNPNDADKCEPIYVLESVKEKILKIIIDEKQRYVNETYKSMGVE